MKIFTEGYFSILFELVLMFIGLILIYFLLNFIIIKKLKVKITERQLLFLIIGLYFLVKGILIFGGFYTYW